MLYLGIVHVVPQELHSKVNLSSCTMSLIATIVLLHLHLAHLYRIKSSINGYTDMSFTPQVRPIGNKNAFASLGGEVYNPIIVLSSQVLCRTQHVACHQLSTGQTYSLDSLDKLMYGQPA